jgi:hypothetical protein
MIGRIIFGPKVKIYDRRKVNTKADLILNSQSVVAKRTYHSSNPTIKGNK